MTDPLNLLLDAAEQRIRAYGYHAVSFRGLADDLGIKSSSVHYYFRQKEDLGVSLVHRYSERFNKKLAAIADESVEQKLQAFCDLYRVSLSTHDTLCLCCMLGVESRGLPEVVIEAVQKFLQGNINWVVETIPSEVDLAERQRQAATIVSGLNGAMMMAVCLKDFSLFDQTVTYLLRPYQERQ